VESFRKACPMRSVPQTSKRSASQWRRALWPLGSAAVLALTIALVLCVVSSDASAFKARNVVLVIVDGLRYSEGLGDPEHKYVPRMHELAQEGATVEPFLNDRYTITARGIPAIWCGAWADLKSVSNSGCSGGHITYCELPTAFEYYRKQLGRPEQDCIMAHCQVAEMWKGSIDPEYGPKYWPLYHCEDTGDVEVWEDARSLLETYHPTFFLLYLERVDHFAHTGSWTYYTRSIEIADSIVGALWDFLESDSVYAGATTLLVTNDHGRHTEDFSSHGDECEGCRTVQLLAVGPDVKTDFVSNIPRTICDITPTIGLLLGFTASKSTGSAMTELFVSPE